MFLLFEPCTGDSGELWEADPCLKHRLGSGLWGASAGGPRAGLIFPVSTSPGGVGITPAASGRRWGSRGGPGPAASCVRLPSWLRSSGHHRCSREPASAYTRSAQPQRPLSCGGCNRVRDPRTRSVSRCTDLCCLFSSFTAIFK